MSSHPGLTVVVPCYNEEGRLETTLRNTVAALRAQGRGFEVIVVDDGSVDGTSALARRLGAEFPECSLLRLAANRGKGYAVRTGVLNARGSTVLFMDADGATPMSELARLEGALDSGADVAIGSRVLPDAAVTVRAKWYRRMIGRGFQILMRALTDTRGIRDTQCGFKLFRGEVAQDLFSRMRMNGFSFDVEVLMMAQRRGYQVAEVPVNWEHQPGSRVNLVLDSIRMARDLFIIRARELRGDYRLPHVARLSQQAIQGQP